MSIRFACSVCSRIITDWRATVDAPSGRVVIEGHCHGEVFSFPQIIEAQGVAFHGLDSVLELPTRDPDEYLRLTGEASGTTPDRGVAGRSAKSRLSKNAALAQAGE